MATHVYRYVFDLVNASTIANQVPPPVTVGGEGPSIYKDIVIDESSKPALDGFMNSVGFSYLETDPTLSPSHQATVSVGVGQFIFRPGEPDPKGNVYADWAQLVAAASLIDGQNLVYFDDSLAACVIPAGAWDFGSPSLFWGNTQYPSGTPLAIADGATLLNVTRFQNLNITSNSTSFVIDVPAGTPTARPVYAFDGFTKFTQVGVGGSFLRVASATVLNFTLLAASSVAANSKLIDTTVAGAQVVVSASATSNLGSDTIAGVAGSNYLGVCANAGASVSATQTGLPGGTFSTAVVNSELSAKVAYSDAVSPALGATQVQAALDALKSKIGKNVAGAVWSSAAGSPEGVVVGSSGDLYTNTTGGAGTTLYVKESGVSTNTGWVAK